MGRNTGPVERLSRREGVELYLKGLRALNGKSALVRRGPLAPGQHGAGRPRKQSVFGQQLRAKQLAKRYYGIRERQFRRYVRDAQSSLEGESGTVLLASLERRLDNVVYRLGLASTRAQARQFVGHGHVLVDGERVDRPSYLLAAGQTVALREGSPVSPLAREATELLGTAPSWLETDLDGLRGRVLRLPLREEIAAPVQEQMIIEFYSRR